MKIIKPYGRSVVEAPGAERKLDLSGRAKQTTKGGTTSLQDIHPFLTRDERFFLGQWVSMLDKLLPKPRAGNPTPATWKAREAAGKAFVEYWSTHRSDLGLEKESLKRIEAAWQKKVHPYGGQTKDSPDKARVGRWLKILGGCGTAEDCDWAVVAKRVYQHLYHKHFRLDGKQASKGLIAAKADAIARNRRKYSIENGKLKSASANEQRHLDALAQLGFNVDYDAMREPYRLADLVQKWNEATEENATLTRQEAAAILNAHLASFHKDENGNRLPSHLWIYHCMVREAMRYQFPKKRRPTPRRPITAGALHHLAVVIELNRRMAFAIRLGKVLHYQRQTGEAKLPKPDEVATSHFWTTRGQTEIKQNEAFVRQWLRALALANTTFARLLDPQGEQNSDVLMQRTFQEACKKIDDAQFNEQFGLLFGAEHALYKDIAQRDALLRHLQTFLSQLRHAVFHFKGIDAFNAALDATAIEIGKKNETLQVNIDTYIQRHLHHQRQRIIETLRSAFAEYWLPGEKIRAVLARAMNGKRSLLPLPRFNRLLERAANKKIQLKQAPFLPPANRMRMDSKAGYRTAFILLKLLYERDFGQWLEQQQWRTVQIWVNLSMDAATREAQNIFKDDPDVTARVERLRGLNENETLVDYFSYLTGEIASEDMVQKNDNLYASSGDSARAVANYVENLKLDVLIHALKKYLTEARLESLGQDGALSRITEERRIDLDDEADYWKKQSSDGAVKQQWLYLALHFMPVEAVNHLALQVIKNRVLTGGEHYDDLHQALTLYMDMHDHLVGGTKSLSHDDQLSQFYEDEKVFAEQFGNNDDELIPVRGLREILRFGNLPVLTDLFKGHAVTRDDVDKLRPFLSVSQRSRQNRITRLQQQREQLHQELVNNKGPRPDDLKAYQTCNKEIVEYRELKNKVYLHNVKLAHQLMMGALGRLVGFSQLWERDIYFVLLALAFVRGIDVGGAAWETVSKKLDKGQILAALDKATQLGEEEQLKTLATELQQTFGAAYGDSNRQTRNDLAHFNSLRGGNGVGLTSLLNRTRAMMAYDRKLKNAVTKSIKELFARENLMLSFRMDNNGGRHQLVFDKLSAQKICHLTQSVSKAAEQRGKNERSEFKKQYITEEVLHSERFCRIISNLM